MTVVPAPAPVPVSVSVPDNVAVPTAAVGEVVSPSALLEEFFAVAAAPDATITVAGVIIFVRQLDMLRATMPPTATPDGLLRIPHVRYIGSTSGGSHKIKISNSAAMQLHVRLVQRRAVAKVLCTPADRRMQCASQFTQSPPHSTHPRGLRVTDCVQALAVPMCAPAVLRLLAEFGEAAPDVHIWHHAELAHAICTTVVSLVGALDKQAEGPTAAIGSALRATMAGLFREAQTPSKTGAWKELS